MKKSPGETFENWSCFDNEISLLREQRVRPTITHPKLDVSICGNHIQKVIFLLFLFFAPRE
jgi:hypothetical protein